MSDNLKDIRFKLKKELPVLRLRYNIETLELFGSYVRGEQKPDSDLDILVTFNKTPSLFEFLELEEYLSNLLGVKVDLVMKSALKPGIGRRILKETERIL